MRSLRIIKRSSFTNKNWQNLLYLQILLSLRLLLKISNGKLVNWSREFICQNILNSSKRKKISQINKFNLWKIRKILFLASIPNKNYLLFKPHAQNHLTNKKSYPHKNNIINPLRYRKHNLKRGKKIKITTSLRYKMIIQREETVF